MTKHDRTKTDSDSQPGRSRENARDARVDEIGHTGVYPVSASEGASPDAQVRGEASWGQGERGAEGYNDSGSSELFSYGRNDPLSGTNTADQASRPVSDIASEEGTPHGRVIGEGGEVY